MNTLKDKINADLVLLLCREDLSKKERAVLAVLSENWCKQRVKQRDIAEHRFWRKTLPDEERELSMPDTQIRQVRRTIRHLRVVRRLPILHDCHGHYLPESEEQIEKFIIRLEREAKRRAASSMETYKVMKESVGITSNLFEQMDMIGDQLVIQYP